MYLCFRVSCQWEKKLFQLVQVCYPAKYLLFIKDKPGNLVLQFNYFISIFHSSNVFHSGYSENLRKLPKTPDHDPSN